MSTPKKVKADLRLFEAQKHIARLRAEVARLTAALADIAGDAREKGAEIERLLAERAAHLEAAGHMPPDGSASQAYASAEGVVRLPPYCMEHLGIERGGGVVFLRNGPGEVRLISDEHLLEMVEGNENIALRAALAGEEE